MHLSRRQQKILYQNHCTKASLLAGMKYELPVTLNVNPMLRTECMFRLVTDYDLIKCWGVERTCVLFFNVYIYIIMWGAINSSNPSDYSIGGKDNWLEENLCCF